MADAIFRAGPVRAIGMREEDLPRLQSFFEANPEYSLTVEDEPPAPDVATTIISRSALVRPPSRSISAS